MRVSGTRLQTFASHPLCCSNPDCGLVATHFALERSTLPAHTGGKVPVNYHLNLYGLDAQGKEVLITHDHTLARGLGGLDELSNTTPMCLPCNARKSKLESTACNQRPSNRQAAFESDIGERRVTRAREQMARMAKVNGLSVAVYADQCEALAQRTPKMGTSRLARRPLQMKLARKLNLSPGALAAFKHDHNLHELKNRSTQGLDDGDETRQAESDGSRAERARNRLDLSHGQRRRLRP